jgi:hypothetical protein
LQAKKARARHKKPNDYKVKIVKKEPQPIKAYDLLKSIAQLLMQGTYPGTHAKLIKSAIAHLDEYATLDEYPEGSTQVFMGIGALLMEGLFPATHASLVSQAVDTMEFFAKVQAEKDKEKQPKEEDKADPELDDLEQSFKEHERVENEQDGV